MNPHESVARVDSSSPLRADVRSAALNSEVSRPTTDCNPSTTATVATVDSPLASHAFTLTNSPLTTLISLNDLKTQTQTGIRNAALAAGGLVIGLIAFIAVGTYAFSGFAQTESITVAAVYLALIKADLWLGVKVGGDIMDFMDRCLTPGRLLAEAKARGELCDKCVYPLLGLESPRCPECGELVARMRASADGHAAEERAPYLSPKL